MRKWVAPAAVLVAFVASAIVYPRLPELVPVHWDAHGNVNGYGSRLVGAFGMPLVMLGVWLLLRLLPRIDPRRANYAKFADTYDLVVNSLVGLFLVMHLALLTRTHRVGGYLLAGAGVVLFIAAFVPGPFTFIIGMSAVLAATFASIIYSYFAWKQETSK